VLSTAVPVPAGEAPGGRVRPVSTKSLERISSRAHTAPVNASAAVTISRSLRPAALAGAQAADRRTQQRAELGSSRHRRTKQNAGSVPPQIGQLPAFRLSRSGLPEAKSRLPPVRQRFFPENFRSATKRAAQDQRSMYATSSASRVMVASGSAASYLGTSEFVMSTARMPTLLAPWMSS
jgi:hypothetical protein